MAILSFALFWRKTLRRSVCIRSFSGLYFPVFGPEKLRIRSFHAVKCFHILLAFYISNIVGNIFFKYKLVQNIVDKYTKLSNISIFIERFTANFSQFCSTNLPLGWPTEYLLINSKHFMDFPRFKLFVNSWGNSYIHLLMKIT